jgi:defect-in-organelle-trafficking protein DotD
MDIKLRISVFALCFALSACGGHACLSGACGGYAKDDARNGDYLVQAGVQKAQTKLAEAALSTSDSLGQLAAMEKVDAPKSKLSPPLRADSVGLGGLASVDWTGPVEPLVLKLAHAGKYKFRAIGKNPAIPVLVAVYATNMPIADILRDANLQAGRKADIMVYPSQRLIELRYR